MNHQINDIRSILRSFSFSDIKSYNNVDITDLIIDKALLNRIQNKGHVPAHFQKIIDQASEEDRTCAICLSVVSNNMYLTPCFHIFHSYCINNCLKEECPTCRQNL